MENVQPGNWKLCSPLCRIKGRDFFFSALSDTFVLQKKKMFISCVVPGATWRLEPYVARQKKDLRPVCKVGMNLQGENKSVFQLF